MIGIDLVSWKDIKGAIIITTLKNASTGVVPEKIYGMWVIQVIKY